MSGPPMAKRHQIVNPKTGAMEQDTFRINVGLRKSLVDKQADFKQVVAVAEKLRPDAKVWKELFGNEAPPVVTGNEIPVGTKPGTR